MPKLLNKWGVVIDGPERDEMDRVSDDVVEHLKSMLDDLDLQDVFVVRHYLTSAISLRMDEYMMLRQTRKREDSARGREQLQHIRIDFNHATAGWERPSWICDSNISGKRIWPSLRGRWPTLDAFQYATRKYYKNRIVTMRYYPPKD